MCNLGLPSCVTSDCRRVQVSDELIRVAILWDNRWHEGLEEASRLYFGERNISAMFGVLEPLHAMMERGPETLKEKSFTQVRGPHGSREWSFIQAGENWSLAEWGHTRTEAGDWSTQLMGKSSTGGGRAAGAGDEEMTRTRDEGGTIMAWEWPFLELGFRDS